MMEYVIKSGWNNALLAGRCTASADCTRLNTYFHSAGFPYRSIWYPPEVDAVTDEATSTDDFEIKKKKTQEAMALTRDKYCTLTVVAMRNLIAARYPYVHDDGLYELTVTQNSLQDAWMEK